MVLRGARRRAGFAMRQDLADVTALARCIQTRSMHLDATQCIQMHLGAVHILYVYFCYFDASALIYFLPSPRCIVSLSCIFKYRFYV